MKARIAVSLAVGCLVLGTGIGWAAKSAGPGIDALRGQPPKDAAAKALAAAETLAGKGSWELISVGRVHYLGGDKAHGQAIFDRIAHGTPEGSDWQRIGEVYAAAGENAKAEECFQRTLAMSPKDDTGQAEIGSWYIRIGQRDKGEELLGRAMARSPDSVWHYVRAAEAYLGVAEGR